MTIKKTTAKESTRKKYQKLVTSLGDAVIKLLLPLPFLVFGLLLSLGYCCCGWNYMWWGRMMRLFDSLLFLPPSSRSVVQCCVSPPPTLVSKFHSRRLFWILRRVLRRRRTIASRPHSRFSRASAERYEIRVWRCGEFSSSSAELPWTMFCGWWKFFGEGSISYYISSLSYFRLYLFACVSWKFCLFVHHSY